MVKEKLTGGLTELAPHLRAKGVDIVRGQTPGSNIYRTVSIKNLGKLTGATDANAALDTNAPLVQPAPTNVELTQKSIDLTPSQPQSDGCDSFIGSVPEVSTSANSGNNGPTEKPPVTDDDVQIQTPLRLILTGTRRHFSGYHRLDCALPQYGGGSLNRR